MADHDAAESAWAEAPTGELAGARPALATPGRWQFCHLPFAYQLVIWAARMWNNDRAQPAERWATIRQAFAKVNAEDATVPFLRLMEVVQTGARQAILVGEGGCTVFADEIRLAEVLACSARGDGPGAGRHLRYMLAPSAARIAQRLAADIAAELDRAGLRFRRTGSLTESEAAPSGAAVH